MVLLILTLTYTMCKPLREAFRDLGLCHSEPHGRRITPAKDCPSVKDVTVSVFVLDMGRW